jgi:hypothetical protein
MIEDWWKDNLRESIRYLSDHAYQEKAWLGKSSQYVSSFTEDVNALDDNCIEDFIKEVRSMRNTSEFCVELEGLYKMVESYNPDYGDEKIIKDPDWISITEQAKKVLNLWDIYL